jgi:hypothetical protein
MLDLAAWRLSDRGVFSRFRPRYPNAFHPRIIPGDKQLKLGEIAGDFAALIGKANRLISILNDCFPVI